jgi:hypothetical protein
MNLPLRNAVSIFAMAILDRAGQLTYSVVIQVGWHMYWHQSMVYPKGARRVGSTESIDRVTAIQVNWQ